MSNADKPVAVSENEAGEEQPLTLQDVLNIALNLQKEKRFDDAERIYRSLLEDFPDEPTANQFLGVLLHQTGRTGEATPFIDKALEVDADNPWLWSNYGNILTEERQFERAVTAYEKAVALYPDNAPLLANLAVPLRALKRFDEAEAALRRSVEIDPDLINGWFNLSNVLINVGRVDEALKCTAEVMVRAPDSVKGYRQLAIAYQRLGRMEEAREVFEAWCEKDPDNPIPKFYHDAFARATGHAPDRAPDEFVERLFDEFSNTFERVLTNLDYQAPPLVAAMLERHRGERSDLFILDAGCGTGLCGPLIKKMTRRLEGVDLSGGMLTQAFAQKSYDDLHKAELTAFIGAHPKTYDAIVICDTLCYIGDLVPVAKSCGLALQPGGLMVATCESLDDEADDGGAGYILGLAGRYAHRQDYIRRTFEAAGLRLLDMKEDVLRTELGAPVHGFVFAFENAV